MGSGCSTRPTLALASGATTLEAAEIASCAATVVVSRDGTAACTGGDLWGEVERAAGTSPGNRLGSTFEASAVDIATFGEGNGKIGSADLERRRAPALHQA